MKHRSPTAPPSKIHPDQRKKESKVKARGRVMEEQDWDVPNVITTPSTGKKNKSQKKHDDRMNILRPLLFRSGIINRIKALPFLPIIPAGFLAAGLKKINFVQLYFAQFKPKASI
jgi:hypothetical protein